MIHKPPPMARTYHRIASPAARIFTALAFCCLVPYVLHAHSAQAQSQSLAATQRVIQGKVVNGGGAPQQGAIVYLKNAKTLEVRTYISTADGSYRFGQLGLDSDFTLWADLQGKKSKEKTISSFDSRKVVTIDLKIDTSK